MIFQILLAVALFSNYGNYGVSGEAFMIYVHRYSSKPPGTCFHVICEKSTRGVTYDCWHRFTRFERLRSAYEGLKLKENSQNEYDNTNDKGELTIFSSKIEIYDGVFIYRKWSEYGTAEAICATYSNMLTEKTTKILNEKCKFDRVNITRLNNCAC